MPQVIPIVIAAFQTAVTWAATTAASATLALTGSAVAASFVGNAILAAGGMLSASVAAGAPLAAATGALLKATVIQQLMKAISAKPKNLNGGAQIRFGPNPQAPRPFLFGRTGTAGTPVVATTHGTGKSNNKWLTYIVALSAFGPVNSIEALALNGVNAPTSGGMVVSGQYANKVWNTYRTGDWGQAWTPTFGPSTIPEWTSNHRGAGIAHACLTYEYDPNVFTGGAPAPVWTVQGSTGIYNASTLSIGYSGNPADVYYTILRGIQSPNGTRLGVGLAAGDIDQAKIAAWRAVCVANNWTCGGVWQVTAETPADVLRAVLQAGGAEFAINDGKASVDFFASAASAYTIRENDLAGDPIERPSTDRKARVSRIIPRFRSEADGWDLVPAAPVVDTTLDTQDGNRRRTETMDFPYVSSAQQARQLAAYNLRARRSPIFELPIKPHGVGIPCGARVTLDLGEYGISTSTCVVIKNDATATDGGTLTVRSDPADLHTWALGQDGSTVSPGSMPRDPASLVQYVDTADWSAVAASITASGTTLPIIRVTGTFPNPTLARLDVQIKPNASTDWIDTNSLVSGTPALEIRGLTPDTIYNVRARYVTTGGAASAGWTTFANVTTGSQTVGSAGTAGSVPWTGVTGGGKPADNATVNRITASASAPASPINGDVWVDTNAPVTIKTRVAGAWVASGNIPTSLDQVNTTEAGKLTGIAIGATKNVITTGTLAARPAGADGDLHYATDTFELYQKVSGAWVLSSTVGGRVGVNIRLPDNSIAPVGRIDNAANPLGENQVVNSDLNQGLNGFEFVFADGTNLTGPGLSTNGGRNLVGSVPAVNYFGARNVFWSTASVSSGNFTGGTYLENFRQLGVSGPTPSNLRRYATQVTPGERIYYSAKIAVHGMTTAVAQVNFYDRDGFYLSTASTPSVIGDGRTGGPNGQWGLPSNFAHVGGFAIVPANATFAAIGTSGNTLNGAQPSVLVFACDYFVAKVGADQNVAPAYNAGPVDRAADRTAEQQRSIVPQFPVIEIKQGEAGHTGNRTVTHAAFAGSVGLSGGIWSLPATNLFGGSASINSVTGIVTLWGITQSGTYTVRYTHTDGLPTELAVNVTYFPAPPAAGVSSKIVRDDTPTGVASGTYSAVLTGVIDGGATGLAKVELNYLPLTWSGLSSNFQFRLTRAGVTLAETGVFNGIDGAGDIGDFLTEIQTLAGFYSVTAGTATWSLEARRTSGSGTVNTVLGELIVTQTPT